METSSSTKKYKDSQKEIFSFLINYKNSHITKENGQYRGKIYDCLLPERYEKEAVPAMIYQGIGSIIEDIQASTYKYKPHKFAYTHVASSQTACLNLFIPVLESTKADDILKASMAMPSDFDYIERKELFHGYRFEFWDDTDETKKGLLKDHSRLAGTDSDVAIAYRNTSGELCLWLIEHKLTEKDFTNCGGYKSRNNTSANKELCINCNLTDLLTNHHICYYDRGPHYNYWEIMSTKNAQNLFSGIYNGKGCPFLGGMNQLWRNQMLALALENQVPNKYKKVYFSVVHHPANHFLDKSMNEYKQLVNNSPKFSSFTTEKIINAASIDKSLTNWTAWYKEVYYGQKN